MVIRAEVLKVRTSTEDKEIQDFVVGDVNNEI